MANDTWVVSVPATAANGNLIQLFPQWLPTTVTRVGSTLGQNLREPDYGAVHSVQVRPDATNAGTIELYDFNGANYGADVSGSNVITNAQLLAGIAARDAKLVWNQDIPTTTGTGVINPAGVYLAFMHGLVARFVAAGGSIILNLRMQKGYKLNKSLGGY